MFAHPFWIEAQSVILAQTGTVDFSVFAQYGVLGIFAGMLVWFAKGAHQREKERSDRLEEENRRLNSLMLDRVIPALLSATRAAEESTQLLQGVQREREQQRLIEQQRPPNSGKQGGDG